MGAFLLYRKLRLQYDKNSPGDCTAAVFPCLFVCAAKSAVFGLAKLKMQERRMMWVKNKWESGSYRFWLFSWASVFSHLALHICLLETRRRLCCQSAEIFLHRSFCNRQGQNWVWINRFWFSTQPGWNECWPVTWELPIPLKFLLCRSCPHVSGPLWSWPGCHCWLWWWFPFLWGFCLQYIRINGRIIWWGPWRFSGCRFLVSGFDWYCWVYSA